MSSGDIYQHHPEPIVDVIDSIYRGQTLQRYPGAVFPEQPTRRTLRRIIGERFGRTYEIQPIDLIQVGATSTLDQPLYETSHILIDPEGNLEKSVTLMAHVIDHLRGVEKHLDSFGAQSYPTKHPDQNYHVVLQQGYGTVMPFSTGRAFTARIIRVSDVDEGELKRFGSTIKNAQSARERRTLGVERNKFLQELLHKDSRLLSLPSDFIGVMYAWGFSKRDGYWQQYPYVELPPSGWTTG